MTALDLGTAYQVLEWAIRIGALMVIPFKRKATATAWLLFLFLLPVLASCCSSPSASRASRAGERSGSRGCGHFSIPSPAISPPRRPSGSAPPQIPRNLQSASAGFRRLEAMLSNSSTIMSGSSAG